MEAREEPRTALATLLKNSFREHCRQLQANEDWATVSDTLDNLITKHLPAGSQGYLPVQSVPVSPPAEAPAVSTREPIRLSSDELKTMLDAIRDTEDMNHQISGQISDLEGRLVDMQEELNRLKGGWHKRKREEQEATHNKKFKAQVGDAEGENQ